MKRGKSRISSSPTRRSTIFFFPERNDFSAERKFGQHNLPRFGLVTNAGVTAPLVGVAYLTGAGTTGPVKNWYFDAAKPYARSCTGDFFVESPCLTAGVYTAQLRYRLKTPSGERDVLYPIAMTVVP